MPFIQVAARVNESVGLPLEEDGTLLLSTMRNKYPGAIGLIFNDPEGRQRSVCSQIQWLSLKKIFNILSKNRREMLIHYNNNVEYDTEDSDMNPYLWKIEFSFIKKLQTPIEQSQKMMGCHTSTWFQL
ncbi:CLUMA_CG000946, isoform A [Clunio marinus]|uniref:CLUMA_CG000946, isoform A n=1 Tax=Clunio marinus TaxID=568069 RepID=A0A1J1HLM7_9DIPT|nr:CLUMA_CG000946, isoform A [Clunio marinus]